MPAWVIYIEKLVLAVIKSITKGKLTCDQFGFKESSDCNLAKLRIFYLSRKHSKKRMLLIDVKKAYDSVDREKLKKKITEKFSEKEATILNLFIDAYRLLQLDFYGTIIQPTMGLPQGSALSPILFNIYIDDILREMNYTHPEAPCTAYADDINLQSESQENLQLAFNKLQELLTASDLVINTNKCEYISDSDGYIYDQQTQNSISSIKEAKYLGQLIDGNTNSTAITSRNFGILVDILKTNTQLTKRARISLFQSHMRSKINHLISVITLGESLAESWKNIRSVIFNFVFQRATFPKESASLFKMGFYDIMIRPLVKVIERNLAVINDLQQTEFLKEVTKKALLVWLSIETNQFEKVKELVRNTQQGQWFSSEQWDRSVREHALNRIYRGANLTELGPTITKLKKPNLILYLSNARMHEVSERLMKILKATDNETKNIEKSKILSIFEHYIRLINLVKNSDCEITDFTSLDLYSKTEAYTLLTINIEQKLKVMQNNTYPLALDCVSNLMNANSNWTDDNGEEGLNLLIAYNILQEFRLNFKNSSPLKHEELEIALELNIALNPSRITKSTTTDTEKRRPGRPRNITRSDNFNSTQKTLDFFVKKKF